MARRPMFAHGAWPARMPVEMAAGYCGERSAEAFLCRVGKEYPEPVIKSGRRQLWLKEGLDSAINSPLRETAIVGAVNSRPKGDVST
jgi:hypothetical protein